MERHLKIDQSELNQSVFTTVYAAHVKDPQHCRGAVGTSSRAVACACASQPQPLPCVHPSVPSHGHRNLLLDCGDDLLRNDLLLSSSALLTRRSSHSDDASSPAREFSVSVRSPFLPSPTPMSPCRRFVSIVAVSVANSSFLYERRMASLAVLFVTFQGVCKISGHATLQHQNTTDLAALRCMTAEIAELARSEPQDSWVCACLNFRHLDSSRHCGAAGNPEPPFTGACLNFNHFDTRCKRGDIIWLPL